MLVELIAIILIIVLSYILCMNEKNYRCQVSHIAIGLSVMVFYKLINYFHLRSTINTIEHKVIGTTENFEQLPDSINTFILGEDSYRPSSNSFTTMSTSNSQQYLNKLDSLVNAIESLKQESQSTSSSIAASNNSTVDRLNLESLQQYQNFQIQYLQNQINKTKDLINSQQMAELSKKYKPIKVYSSCVVSNADGTITSDEPVSNKHNQLGGLGYDVNQQMLTTITQGRSVPAGSSLSNPQTGAQQMQFSPSIGAFANIINNALNSSSVNVNIK